MPSRVRLVQIALALLALAYVIGQFAALGREGIHWDEFVLLSRAESATRTGILNGGGRPGLGVALLTPFAAGCDSSMHVARAARVVWCVVTVAMLLGAFELFRRVTRRTAMPWHAAALGTAAIALVPIFMRWSLQVRTDQPAIACAIWGGVFLIVSRDRPRLSVIAGALIATGYLFSQKALYLTGLVGVLALGDLYIDRAISWRRELGRAIGFLVGAAAAIGLYQLVIWRLFTPPATSYGVGQALDLLRWYRWMLKFRLYPNMLSSVYPQVALLCLLFVAALRSIRRDTPQRRPLTVALVVLLLGFGVGRFHAGSFPYFWITLGVFPATAIAIGWEGIREMLPRAAVPIAAACWAAMIALAIHYKVETLENTQRIQAQSFAFIERALPASARGFHADGALFCRHEADPLPVFLGENVVQRFGNNNGAYAQSFIREFRTRPVSFLVRTTRLTAFPGEVREFWDQHYVPFRGTVAIAGVHLGGRRAPSIDVIVPGSYRWWGRGTIAIAGSVLASGDRVTLAVGAQAVELREVDTDGILAWATDEPPDPDGRSFYSDQTLMELMGARTTWW